MSKIILPPETSFKVLDSDIIQLHEKQKAYPWYRVRSEFKDNVGIKKRRCMPTVLTLYTHWADTLYKLDKFDSVEEVTQERWYCMACGWLNKKVERCHIFPSCMGGDESLGNLVCLCKTCHYFTENYFWPEDFWYVFLWLNQLRCLQLQQVTLSVKFTASEVNSGSLLLRSLYGDDYANQLMRIHREKELAL